MRTFFASILLILYSVSFCQQRKEYIIKDNSLNIKANPYADTLNKLYPQPATGELYYVPNIRLPKLFIIDKTTNDTIFLKYSSVENRDYAKTLWDYFKELDSTIYHTTKHITFVISVNWDGEIYLIKARKVLGSFDEKRWGTLWNAIKAIPSTEGGIVNSLSFSIPLDIR